MLRFLAGAASCFLMMTGAFLIWQSHAQEAPSLPQAPPVTDVPSMSTAPAPLQAPEATPKSREERRFSRADKDKNGRIEREEQMAPRRKAFAKLDKNGNGTLSFDEWAVKSIDKFAGADRDRSGWLTPAEFATTAPKPPKKKRCAC
ncbi:EF-hand domain-containing protein [Sphingomonas lutea]|uniref:EF-hand domain-containing protein n=1 Tax=Sphingomonas lutea TaxID=1045317 RepID=A0A7G9SFG9_9SPHN|nr:EF-hand domain-containing protein [Sphingomonas lutea]QNN66594.1 EF-hand domain-containing protein [Sphingomonas lutea]